MNVQLILRRPSPSKNLSGGDAKGAEARIVRMASESYEVIPELFRTNNSDKKENRGQILTACCPNSFLVCGLYFNKLHHIELI